MAKESVVELHFDFALPCYKPKEAFVSSDSPALFFTGYKSIHPSISSFQDAAKPAVVETVKTKLTALSKFLGDKDWLAGSDKVGVLLSQIPIPNGSRLIRDVFLAASEPGLRFL